MRSFLLVGLVVMSGCQCGGRLVDTDSRLLVDPEAVTFGAVRAGAIEVREVVARVAGRAAVSITRVQLEQESPRPFSTTLMTRTLRPGDEVRFVVEYAAPAMPSADVGLLVITTDSGEVRVPLSAQVRGEVCSPRTSCLVIEGQTPECGVQPDGCGGTVSCGSCGASAVCAAGRCVALPVDAGQALDAGPAIDAGAATDAGPAVDGGSTHDAGVPVDAGVCMPTSCTALAATCGTVGDGCGGTLSCGSCGAGASCQQNQCVCAAGATESCSDGVDNDCDGNVDCADPDCGGAAACMQPACTVTSPEVQVTSAPGNAYTGFIASRGSGQWGLFVHDTFGNSNLRYTYFALDGQLQTVGAPAPMTGILAAHKPFAAWTGQEFGLAWSDSRNAGQSNDVYFARVSASGQRMLASDVPVSTLPGVAFPASIGWNPSSQEFAVLWADDRSAGPGIDRSLYFRRVDAQGQLVGTEVSLTPSPVGVTTDYSDLVWGGANWGIVATQIRQNAPFMLFNRLSSTGAPELADVQLNAAGQGAFQPRIAASPGHYGVVFQQYRPGTSAQSEVVLALVAKAGPANAVRIPLTTSGSAQSPAIVWVGTGWRVFFSDERTGARRIWMTRLSPTGARLGSDELISCGPPGTFPHASFDGTRVAVTWVATIGSLPQAIVKAFVP
jgi:hypothetical protein